MNLIIKNYIPSFAITFTLVIFYSGVMSLISGTGSLSIVFVAQLSAYLLTAELIEGILDRINFKSMKTYLAAEAALMYVVLLLFAYYGDWILFTMGEVLNLTLAFALIMAAVHVYFYRRTRINAAQINRMLAERENL